MKLNEKGFAFSTMLYGSITLIAIVLYVILNVNKTTNDTTYYFGEEVIKSLNDCVTEEITLENCYSAGGNNCNATAYRACLGVREHSGTNQGVIISEKIKSLDLESDIGLVEDSYENNRYIFAGDSANNYLTYSNRLWRIVSIEPGGHLKLIDTAKLDIRSWDELGSGTWGSNSTLFSVLNINYLSSIADPSKLYQYDWARSILYPSLFDNYTIRNLLEQEKASSNDNLVAAKVGLLSVSDYLKATNNNSCKTNIFGTNFKNCNSWLSQYKSWTININGEHGSDEEGFAYYFGDDTANNKYNTILFERTNEVYDVYPVIYIDRNSIYQSGTGTASSPFILK